MDPGDGNRKKCTIVTDKGMEIGMKSELRNDARGMELILADPDNGLLVSDNAKEKDSEKYILPAEVERMFRGGYNVVYYGHQGRRQYKAGM